MEVLIVEDDNDLRELEATIVKAAGHTPLEAANGTEAIETFENSDCAVVVLDWMLPDLSGIEVAEAFKEIRYAYVIMVTALDKKEHAEEALQAGVKDYMEKPFEPDEFIECLGVAEALVTARERLAKRFERLGIDGRVFEQRA